ncbi:MAG TPA: carbohydrate ABC transporter permease, partial [Roseiflexaceae bacterium]|nr:carbohydrate ABC transporter permease [Roseiflexaceae bacterium]
MSAVTVQAPRRARTIRPSRVVLYATLVFFALFYLMPFYVLFVTALKSFVEVSLDRMWNLPLSFSLQSFSDALLGSETSAIRGIGPNFLNSLQLTIPATIIS